MGSFLRGKDLSWFDDNQVLKDVAGIAESKLKPLANRIDQEGFYPSAVMSELGEAGAYCGHLQRYGARYDLAIDAMTEISRHCGSTGFMSWCHDVCGLYMEQSGNSALIARLDDHVRGTTLGGTGLSNPMKALTGIEKMALKAEKISSGYIVNGSLPWVSHIREGGYCGVIASVPDKADHEIMFLLDLDERAQLKECPKFSGMEGTSTWAIELRDYFVNEDQVIADPVRPFIKRVRPAFVLLQTGFGLGVTQGAIDSMIEVEDALGHVNQFLHDRPSELQPELDRLKTKVHELGSDIFSGSAEMLVDVLDVRAQVSELSLRATQSALLHQGARGYLMSSPVQRRIREAHFVAIVTPAIKHLRWEMSKLMKADLAA